MKAVIFAGGVGTRLWPLSRQKSPKQFERIIGDQSTLQLTVDRLLPEFEFKDIYISTSDRYIKLVKNQLPKIPENNIIGEPEMRDVGPAVGLMTAILTREHNNEPFIILWSDHIVREVALFKKIVKAAGEIISQNKERIVFISQAPRFASQNLGWIEYGKKVKKANSIKFHEFISFRYRPSKKLAVEFFNSGRHSWNLGYFVTTPRFLMSQYKKFVPDMYKVLNKIADKWHTSNFTKVLSKEYPRLEKVHFDNAILEKLDRSKAYVISENIGWSDVGAWEALKEALQQDPKQNVTKGKVLITDSEDNLIYNYTNQTVAAIDLNGLLVVNTADVLLVCDKNSVGKIKKLVESLVGTEDEYLT